MRKLVWILFVAVMAAFPATAQADGIAFAGTKNGGTGISLPDANTHYVTLQLGKETLIEKVSADGSVLQYRTLAGAWGVPLVAFDGSADGLSADGKVLVLAQPPIGRMREVSRFPVLKTRTLRTDRVVTLTGSFSFDAISPDGSTLYVIEHVNRKDVAEYQVRAYDLKRNRLLPYVIRDHRSNQVEMYGYPMSRLVSEDGRWAYTLYQGKHHSFVHALDTVARKAVCIDLPMDTPPEYIGDAHLEFGPRGEVAVESAMGGLVALIDPRTLELRPLPKEPPAAATEQPATAANETVGWVLAGAALAVALIAATVRFRRLAPVPAAQRVIPVDPAVAVRMGARAQRSHERAVRGTPTRRKRDERRHSLVP